MGSVNFFPIGWMNLPSPMGMGLEKVPVMIPVTASELARAELYRMNLDACVRRVDEQHGFIMKL
jgi:hypothetical protein